MFKIFGAVLVISACFGYSCIKCGEINGRLKIAEGLISGFIVLEENICGLHVPLLNAVFAAAEHSGEAKEIFMKASAADGGAEKMFSDAFYGAEEFSSAVLPYIGGITAVGEDERRYAFSAVRTRLEEKRKQFSDELLRLGRLYRALGISFGLLIVILLY